jgi:flagellar secretion chaperone FliS
MSEKARLLNRAVSIIGELRNSLDLKAGGQLAANLGELYDYMGRRLLKAMADNRVEMLDEVCKLLHDIRAAWVAIPAEARGK